MSEPLRLFFAIDLPDKTKAAIEQGMIKLKNHLKLNHATWIQPNNLHVTLQFLKAVSPADAIELVKHARLALSDTHAFHLEWDQVELFPSNTNPHLISLNVGPTKILAPLANKLGNAIIKTGYPVDQRPYRGHMTLVKFDHLDPKNKTLHRFLFPAIDPLLVTEITLFESRLSQHGPQYIPLARLPLLRLP